MGGGGAVLGEGQAVHSPPDRGYGECCKLCSPAGSGTEPQPELYFVHSC